MKERAKKLRPNSDIKKYISCRKWRLEAGKRREAEVDEQPETETRAKPAVQPGDLPD